MNEMIEKMLSRHAIRKFTNRQIEEDALAQIVQAGLHAPSAGNNQRSVIVVCQDPSVNRTLGRISRDMQYKGGDPAKMAHAISAEQPSIQDDLTILDGFYGAPTVLTIFAPDMKYTHEDAAMIAENLMLAAHFLGVGACYIGRGEDTFATEYGMKIRAAWGIDARLIPVGHVILGYLDGPAPKAKPRKEGRVVRVSCFSENPTE